MEWLSFVVGAASSIFVGFVLTAIKSFFDRQSRRIQRQLEIAEMVGAVRSEISHVTKRIDGLTKTLDNHIDHCESRWAMYPIEQCDHQHN